MMTLRFLYCFATVVLTVGAVSLLSACAGAPAGTSGQKASTTLPANSVVLMDPSIDDGMLPALGEHLSNGAVTIYNLDGPGATLPVDIAPAAGTPTQIARGAARPIVSDSNFGGADVSSPPLAIRPPANMTRGDKDPRVTVFDVNTPDAPQTMGAGIGTPVPLSAPVPGGAASPARAPATDPSLRPPTLPPPLSDQTKPLKSPFTVGGTLAPVGGTLAPVSGTSGPGRDKGKTSGVARDMTTWNPPAVTSGSGRRAVTSENLMSSSDDDLAPVPPPRPPRGMTY